MESCIKTVDQYLADTYIGRNVKIIKTTVNSTDGGERVVYEKCFVHRKKSYYLGESDIIDDRIIRIRKYASKWLFYTLGGRMFSFYSNLFITEEGYFSLVNIGEDGAKIIQ